MLPEKFELETLLASFGVGCFHIGSSSTALGKKFDQEQYVEDVREFLNSFSSVEDIKIPKIQYTKLNEKFSFDDTGTISSANGIYPYPIFWDLTFTVQIPDRVQKEIMDRFGRPPDPSNAQKFKVRIHYEDRFPVAFVSGVDAILLNPSQSIVLIREYMRKYAPEDMPVEFQHLGPSPFHADFFVCSSDTENCQITHQRGYDLILYSTTVTEDVEGHIEKIQTDFSKEIGLYYYVVQSLNYLRNRWRKLSGEIEEITNSLAEKNRPGGIVWQIWGRFRHTTDFLSSWSNTKCL